MSTEKLTSQPAPVPPAPPDQAEAKRGPGAPPGNQNRTTHGLRRGTHGPKRRTPNNPDQYDATARRRAQGVYEGLGAAWQPERRSYADDFAAKLRIDRKGQVRGFFNADGSSKDTLRIKLDLDKRLADREREAREAKLAMDCGGADDRETHTRFMVIADTGAGGTCPTCGGHWNELPMACSGMATSPVGRSRPAELDPELPPIPRPPNTTAEGGHVKFFPVRQTLRPLTTSDLPELL